MNIAYVSTFDAKDIHSWSGAGYYIPKSLERQNGTIDYVRVHQKPETLIDRVKSRYYKKVAGQSYNRERTLASGRYYADAVKKLLSGKNDVVFSPGTLPIALLDTPRPKVFYTDATFAGMVGFYDSFSHLAPETIRFGNELEQAALSSCSLAIYASDWAAKTAIDHYNVDPQKIKVVPFGANVESHRSYDDIKAIIDNRSTTTCKLLFLGVEWERKGGDIAVGIAGQLNKAGVKTELHIAGIRSIPRNDLPGYVINHGFVSKASEEGRALFDRLISESHFLVVPTRAEALGLVYCEANSFGVPSIGTAVGGVPSVITDGVNGRAFSLEAVDSDYADYISRLFSNYSSYKQLALSSFNEYQKRLNWNVSGKRIMDLLKSI